MIILHATCLEGRFLLWGETPGEPPGSGTAARRGRKPKIPRPEAFPFDAGFAALASALRDAGIAAKLPKKSQQSVAAWVPTRGARPIPSSPIIGAAPSSRGKTLLAPWSVSALVLPPSVAVDLLCRCGDEQTLARGVVAGQDLAFWAQGLRLAGSLVARQQYLPGLEAEDGTYRACWQPVFAGPDAERLARLANEMPPAARAVCSFGAAGPPETPAAGALERFLGEMVDCLVRSAGEAGEPGAPRRRGRRKTSASFDSVHDHWLHALGASDGLMKGDEAELARFAEQVREWRRPLAVSTASPFRLCFRLEEPAAEDEEAPRRKRRAAPAWFVRFLLQASDDPSLLIPADAAWKVRGREAKLLARAGFDASEYLLSSLGQAAGVCSRIEASLKSARPSGYKLDAAGAHEFLTGTSMALEQAGYGVMLPAWWTRKGTKVRLTASASVASPTMQAAAGLSLAQVVQVNWELALGDETISLEELQALAELKAPLVRVRGQWVELNAEEIQAALAFWEKKASGAATAHDVVRMAVGTGDAPGGLAFGGVKATGWVGDLLAQLDGTATLEELPAPAGFVGVLRPYQTRGYAWLAFLRRWGLGACLADDMGLGKTIQTLVLIQRDWEANGRRPVLLVCPTSVVGNWVKEAERFTPGLPVLVHHGLDRKRGEAFAEAARDHAIVVSSFALLHRDIEHLRKVDWAGIVLDEAQNIKNPQTKQAQAARSLPAGYRVALTGTPVENNVGDLWSIMEFLNPGLLGTQAQFKRRFFIPIQANQDPEAATRLRRITGPFILRRLKTDKTIIADLPEKLEMKVFCTLTKEQASLYAAVVKDAEGGLESSEGIQRKGIVLATLSKLKQVCNHPAQLLGDNSAIPGRSGKLARLTEMLEEILTVGDRALVFSQFAEMGELLRRHVQETFGREVLFLHGAVPKKRRDTMVERFQADEGPAVFVLSLKAGGTGLNLTRANHVFHFDRWWNPAVENQATDRAFRIGQTRNVQVHKFLCAGTLEEKIDEMIERKKDVAGKVVGSGEGWLTKLSNTQLKDLFALKQEALGE